MLAIDTETTGPDLFHGCKPFYVSTCDDIGNVKSFNAEVNPFTREPEWEQPTIDSIKKHISLSAHLRKEDFVFHNTKFDVRSLAHIGVDWQNYWLHTQDTLIASHIFNSNESHKLKELALIYCELLDDDESALRDAVVSARHIGKGLGFDIAREEHPHFPGVKSFSKRKEAWRFDTWLPRAVALHKGYASNHPWYTILDTYADRDAERTILLWLHYLEELGPELFHIYEERIQDLKVSYDIEQRGVTNLPCIFSQLESYRKKTKDFAANVVTNSPLPKFVLQGTGSRKNILHALYAEEIPKCATSLNLPIKDRTDKGAPSTGIKTLVSMLDDVPENSKANKFLTNLILWKKTHKAIEYLESYDAYSVVTNAVIRLHPNLNPTGTHTTRFSSSNPNQQNVGNPEDGSSYEEKQYILSQLLASVGINLRSVYGPTPSRMWYGIDYASLQLRIFAYCCGEQSLIDAFERGEDPHDFMARTIFNLNAKPTKTQRRIAKNVNFGYIFGASPKKIETTSGVTGLWSLLTKRFPSAIKFIDTTSHQVRQKGYISLYDADNETLAYRLNVPRSDPHKGVNYIVQGYEGIIVKRAMIACHTYLDRIKPLYRKGKEPFITMQVHDELVFDAPYALFPNKKENTLPHKLCKLMEDAGQTVGMSTPVECDILTTSWDNPEKLTLKRN